MAIEIAVLTVALTAIALIGLYTAILGVPPMPTSARVRRVMFAMAPDRVDGTVHELGAAWGGLGLDLARRYPENTVVGHEASPLPWLVSRLRLALSGRGNLQFRRGDIFGADLRDAGLVLCYLHADVMARLRDKFEAELGADCVVLCNTFAVPGWHADELRRTADLYRSPVYRYRAGSAFPSASREAAAVPRE